jgi:hypothetical protein
MNIETFKRSSSVENVNTNNAWGFGGWIGKRFVLGTYVVEDGKLCYRHANPSKVSRYKVDGKEVSEKEFERKISELC